MKNQEYILYAYHMGDVCSNDNLMEESNDEMEFININGQLIPVYSDVK
jgi:hypothetical protein